MEEEVGSTDTRRTTYIATRRHVPRRIRVWVYHDRMSRARTASHGSPVYRLEKNRREGEKTDRGRTLRAAAENWRQARSCWRAQGVGGGGLNEDILGAVPATIYSWYRHYGSRLSAGVAVAMWVTSRRRGGIEEH